MKDIEILANAPEGVTHYHPNFKKYYRFSECEVVAEIYLKGEWERYPLYPSIRSLSDIQTIVDLRRENAELKQERQSIIDQHDMWKQQWHELNESLSIRDLEQQLKILKQYANTCGVLRQEPSTRDLHESITWLENQAKALRGE